MCPTGRESESCKHAPGPSVLSALRSFNRKERYLLLQWALDRPGFALGDDFRAKLEAVCTDLNPTAGARSAASSLSGETVVAMDYHLDWLFAALEWAERDIRVGKKNRRASGLPAVQQLSGTQEDVDLLVAARGPKETTTVVLCEAKAYSPEDHAQLRHKAERLQAIFGEDGSTYPSVVPRFVLLGPKAPRPEVTRGWPRWMTRPDGTARFIALPAPDERYSVRRENNTPDWSWWKITRERWSD